MNEFVVLAVLLALVVVRLLGVTFLVLFILRPVRGCPACFRETVPVRKPWLRFVGLGRLEWRWCPFCGWEAFARRQPAPRTPVRPRDPLGARDASAVHDGEGAGR